MRAGAAIPVAPGEQTLRAVVTVSYELTLQVGMTAQYLP